MKKISLFFAALLTLGLTTRAADGDEFIVDNLRYRVLSETDHEVSLVKCVNFPNGDVFIPAYVDNNENGYSVTEIGERAFFNRVGLTSVTIPNSVTDIGERAFESSGLTSVTIPNSVTDIGESAFGSCSSLQEIVVENGNNNFKAKGGVLYDFQTTELIVYPAGKYGKFDIPNSVTRIGDSAFNGCSDLTSVTIPNSVTRIGDSAFNGCSDLTSVTIPNSVTDIGDFAFNRCSGLTSVIIPTSVTCIGTGVFLYCTGLTSVTIPNSVTRIGADAFGYCSGLTSVTIPNSVTHIESPAFRLCSSLQEIIVDNGNNNYTSIDGVLYDSPITELIVYPAGKEGAFEIPNSVARIGEDAFYWCSGLTTVTIPYSVTDIGKYAFYRSSGLTTIIALPTTPPSCDYTAFEYASQSAVVYIPKGTLNEYSTAEGWSYFSDFREPEDSGIEGVDAGSNNAHVEFFKLNGMGVKGDALVPGVYLKRQGSNVTKVLVK